MSKCRAILIEDDDRLAYAIINFLELNNVLCDHCIDGEKGLQLIEKNSYDVIITDINMPNMTGLQLSRQLRDSGCETPILMITSLAQLDDKVLGFEAGTDDYLVKPFALKELFIRVNALSKRKSSQTTKLLIPDLELEIDFTERKITRRGIKIELTKSCWNVLSVLARAWPNHVKKEDLEFALWGDEVPNSEGLKVQIFHLRQRIDAPFDFSIVQTVRGIGFVLARHHDKN